MTASNPRPTPTQIDDLCLKFDAAKIEVEKDEQAFSTAKGELLAAVQDFGFMPTAAPKTKRLEGILYIADATVSTTVTVDEARVAELESELSRMKKPYVFREMFERKVQHILLKDAAGTLKLAIGGLAPEVQKRLSILFATCFKPKSKAPSLTVDLVAALRQKEAEAQAKAEAKALKAAAKTAKAAKKAGPK